MRRIADLLGPGMELGDTPGGGTIVSLRVRRGQVATLPVPVATGPVVRAEEPRLSLTVPVIDDQEAGRLAMEGFLDQHGCRVLVADSADEAIVTLEVLGAMRGAEREVSPDG